MRMGKPEKVRRGQLPIRADANGKPQHAARGSVVGKLSPDIITVYFFPELSVRAKESLERYSEKLMQYDDAVRTLEAVVEQQNVQQSACPRV